MSSDIPVSVEPTKTVSQLACDECCADLVEDLAQALAFTPQGKARTIVTCPSCGATHALELEWTASVVGIATPDQIGPVPALWTAEEILKREG